MAKGATKSASKTVAAKKGAKKGKRTFAVYVRRSLKAVNKELTISAKASKIVQSFIADQFDRIATEAAHLARANKKSTLGSREVQTAVRLLFPAEIARHAMAEATRAVAKTASA
jgi:histone H2B